MLRLDGFRTKLMRLAQPSADAVRVKVHRLRRPSFRCGRLKWSGILRLASSDVYFKKKQTHEKQILAKHKQIKTRK